MLRINRKTLLAIEAVIIVARGSGKAPVLSSEIADRQGIQRRLIERLMQHLVQTGILVSVRGPKGGYTLPRDGRDISVSEIVRALDQLEREDDHASASALFSKIVYPLWLEVDAMMIEKLDRITIASLCADAEACDVFADLDRSVMCTS